MFTDEHQLGDLAAPFIFNSYGYGPVSLHQQGRLLTCQQRVSMGSSNKILEDDKDR
jgi:hypothetical protein